jgi:hypothetical protein
MESHHQIREVIQMPFDVISYAYAKKFRWSEIVLKTVQVTQLIIDGIEAGEPINKYQLVTFSNGKFYVASADDINRMPVSGIAIASGNAGDKISVVDEGIIENPAWNFPVNVPIYAGVNGTITTDPPDTPGYVVQRLGKTLSATKIYFDPDKTYWTI